MPSSEAIFIPFVLDKVKGIEDDLLKSVADGTPSKSDFVNALVPVCKQIVTSAIIYGYLQGKGFSEYLEPIVKGFERSSCFLNYIPEGEFENPQEYRRSWEAAWNSITISAFDYVDRWITYKEMFDLVNSRPSRKRSI